MGYVNIIDIVNIKGDFQAGNLLCAYVSLFGTKLPKCHSTGGGNI